MAITNSTEQTRGTLLDSTPEAIVASERRGQGEFIDSDVLPVGMGDRREYEALGFHFGELVAGDPLFINATLPPGWKKVPTDHAMWSAFRDARLLQGSLLRSEGAHDAGALTNTHDNRRGQMLRSFMLFMVVLLGCSSPFGVDGEPTYEPLIEVPFTLEPGTEGYRCATKTFEERVLIGAARALPTLGTHHTVVDVGSPAGPDDPGYDCASPLDIPGLFAAGIGTAPLELPEGVALEVPAGAQVLLNAHVYNTGAEPIEGRSGIEVARVAEAEHVAAFSYYGPFSFEIPPNGERTVENDTQPPAGLTVIAVMPHMHQLGTRFRAELVRSDGTAEMLANGAFVFESQQYVVVDPPAVTGDGDSIRTTCTWVNHTGKAVGFGPSSTDEMCFAAVLAF